jgi:NAD(P)-dependent dehydrogenase (short-subunit alcohol dehydrogenase family)
MHDGLDGKVAYVTGGSSGLGLAAATALADAGARVAILDLDKAKGEQAVSAVDWPGDEPLVFECDTGDKESVRRAFAEAGGEVGEPYALVNNAGIREVADFLNLDPEDWDRVIQVNLTGYFYCAQTAARSMVENGGGAIVNISSCAGLAAVPGRPAYNAAKAGVIGLTRTMAHELGPSQIRTNAICPSIIVTPLTEAYFEDEGFAEGMKRIVPLGRPGEAHEVGDLVVYLCGERSSYVSGSIISIDGGFVAGKGFSAADTGADTKFTSPRGVR